MNPKTLKEWQEAADAAHLILALDSCLQYGLITIEGEWLPNLEHCEWILKEAERQGIKPAELTSLKGKL